MPSLRHCVGVINFSNSSSRMGFYGRYIAPVAVVALFNTFFCLILCLLKLMNGTEQEPESSRHLQDIRIFSLFPAKSDMPWYDLRGIQLPWTVPSRLLFHIYVFCTMYIHVFHVGQSV